MRLLNRFDTAVGPAVPEVTDDDLAALREAEAEAHAAEALAAEARARAEAIRAQAHRPDQLPATDVDVAPESELSAPAKRRLRRPKMATVLTAVAVVISVALLAASAYLLRYHRQFEQDQQRRSEFVAAASQAVVTLMSIDSAKAQDDVQRIVANSTGQFRDDFQADAKDFVKVAQEAKASTKATVRTAAVESMSADSAVVLVTAATTVSNATGANQQPRNWRLSVTMVKDGTQFKMAKVEFIP